jgi:hypothetical protein
MKKYKIKYDEMHYEGLKGLEIITEAVCLQSAIKNLVVSNKDLIKVLAIEEVADIQNGDAKIVEYSLKISVGLFGRKHIRRILDRLRTMYDDISYIESNYLFRSTFIINGDKCHLDDILSIVQEWRDTIIKNVQE